MEKTFDWVKAMLGLGIKEPVTDSVEVPRQKKRPMGSVMIEVQRDFKTVEAYVDIDYFRRPEPSTY